MYLFLSFQDKKLAQRLSFKYFIIFTLNKIVLKVIWTSNATNYIKKYFFNLDLVYR